MNMFEKTFDPWTIDEQQFPRGGSPADRLRFLVRFATLAPSTRNTQPWKFCVGDDSIEIFIDPTRWERVADGDQREMYISVGCALENLLIAASHFGYAAKVDYVPDAIDTGLAARARFTLGARPPASEIEQRSSAISRRFTNHGVYDGTCVAGNDLAALSALCDMSDLNLVWFSDDATRAKIDELVTRADALLLSRPEYRQELGEQIGTGAFGNSWLMATLGRFAVAHLTSVRSFVRADHEAIMSSPALGLISATANTRAAQMRAGQVLERIYLEATNLGLYVQPVSQLIQAEQVCAELAALLPTPGLVPLQPFRLGRAKPPKAHTPRRPLEEVLI